MVEREQREGGEIKGGRSGEPSHSFRLVVARLVEFQRACIIVSILAPKKAQTNYPFVLNSMPPIHLDVYVTHDRRIQILNDNIPNAACYLNLFDI